jgi:hypothetical protein
MGLELQSSLFPRQHLLYFQPLIIRKQFEIIIIIIIMYNVSDSIYLKYAFWFK